MPRPARSRVAAARPADQAQEPKTTSRRTRASSSRTMNTERTEEEERGGAKRRSTRASIKSNLPQAGLLADDEAAPAGAGDTSEDAEISPVEGGRREPTVARPRRTDVSGLDIEDNMSDVFGNLDSSFDDDSHGSPSAAQHHTTTADNTSTTFTIGAFKRRPRQSSIVGRDDAPIRPSSRGLNTPGISSTFTLGAFKRRQREPSILGAREPSVSGSAQKESPRQPEAQAAGDESDDVDESFLPEAEGTPIRRSSGRRLESNPEETSPDASPGRASRKRRSLEDHPGNAKRQAVSASDDLHDSIEVDDGPPTPPDNVARPLGNARASADAVPNATPALDDDDVMAPPRSSSSSAGSAVWPPLEMLGRKRLGRPASRSRTTPVPGGDVSDISSPPSLTYSPNFPASPAPAAKGRARNTAKPKSPPKTTEELATLLPRRRPKKSKPDDLFGLDTSEDEEDEHDDEDEAPYASRRRGRSRRPVRPLSGTAAAKQPKAKDTGKAPAASHKSVRRTYGSRNFSDKENQAEGETIEVAGHESAAEEEEDAFASDGEDEGEDETTQADLGDELKKAAKKFKEVDRWELEFEEIAPSSSPKAAR